MTMVGACSCQIIRQKSTMVVSTGPVRREGGREGGRRRWWRGGKIGGVNNQIIRILLHSYLHTLCGYKFLGNSIALKQKIKCTYIH